MTELTTVAMLPDSMTEAGCEAAAQAAARWTREDAVSARRRIATTGFVVERVLEADAAALLAELAELEVAAAALASRQVLPLPRRSLVESVAWSGAALWMRIGEVALTLPLNDFLHAHLARLRVEGRRRRLTRGGRELRVERDMVLADLFFRGGGAYRLDLRKVDFDDDPVLRDLPRSEAAGAFLAELEAQARDLRRPVVPARRVLLEPFESPYWAAIELPALEVFDARGRWYYALAASRQLPPASHLDELLEAQVSGGRRPAPRTSRIGPQRTPPPDRGARSTTRQRPTRLRQRPTSAPPAVSYEVLMREGAELENRGQIDQAAERYKAALALQDTFEVRLALIEALVDHAPFEAWRLCAETAAGFPEASQSLVEEYNGVHRENYDCHDFLTYRGLRRFLRVSQAEDPKIEPLKRFFAFHELSNKLPDQTKGGLLDAYGAELGFRFPAEHRALIASYNGLDLFNRAFRFLGVGGDDPAFDLFLFNDENGWRRFYGPILAGLVGFGFDYLGNVTLYDPRQTPDEPPIVRLDADTGELEPVADSFAEFLTVDLSDADEDVVRPRLLREWQQRRGPLGMRECLAFQTSPVLGGERAFGNLTTSELGIRLHMAGQVATQARQIPEGAQIRGVRIVNQEELLLKVFWEM